MRLSQLAVTLGTVLTLNAGLEQRPQPAGVKEVTEADVAGAIPNIAPSERILGLTTVWREARENFPYFDRQPALDWDSTYLDFIGRVLAAPHAVAYYDTLMRFSALLRDGHTNIYYPPAIQQQRLLFTMPRIELAELGGEIVVVNADSTVSFVLPLGSVLTRVDGVAVRDVLRDRVFPFVAGGAPAARLEMAISRDGLSSGKGLLTGRVGSTVMVSARLPNGTSTEVRLVRDLFATRAAWVRPRRTFRAVDFRQLDGGLAYLGLNSFLNDSVPRLVDSIAPTLLAAKGIVLDLRNNPGGDGRIGFGIVGKYLSRRAHLTAQWRTRVSAASYSAWGPASASRFAASHGLTYDSVASTFWFEASPDTVRPASDLKQTTSPIVVLIGRNTGSAAEDLALLLRGDPQFTLAGEATFGSSGQPLYFALPGGGRGRVVTKHDRAPDGTEFVGTGVVPDVPLSAQPSQGILVGRDEVLDQAISLLARLSKVGFPIK